MTVIEVRIDYKFKTAIPPKNYIKKRNYFLLARMYTANQSTTNIRTRMTI